MASGDDRDAKAHSLRAISTIDAPMVRHQPRAFVAAPDDDDSIDLREYWKILVKRKWLILALLLVVVTATFVATKLQVPEYRATALVLIEPEATQILAFQDFDQTSGRSSAEYRASQYEILRSRSLAEAVVRAEQLQDHPEFTGQMRQRSIVGEVRGLTSLLARPGFWHVRRRWPGTGTAELIAIRSLRPRNGAGPQARDRTGPKHPGGEGQRRELRSAVLGASRQRGGPRVHRYVDAAPLRFRNPGAAVPRRATGRDAHCAGAVRPRAGPVRAGGPGLGPGSEHPAHPGRPAWQERAAAGGPA
jgi:hypothetical protein